MRPENPNASEATDDVDADSVPDAFAMPDELAMSIGSDVDNVNYNELASAEVRRDMLILNSNDLQPNKMLRRRSSKIGQVRPKEAVRLPGL